MTIVYPDGRVDTETESNHTLEQLQRIVDGYIEMVGCKHPDYAGCICDEEGKLKGKEINPTATFMAGLEGDVFVGVVIFYKRGEVR